MEKKRDLLHASFAVKASMCVMGVRGGPIADGIFSARA